MEKSQFLFEKPVTDFLRQLWLDAVNANYDRRIVAGEIQGDRQRAVDRSYSLACKYLNGSADEPSAIVQAFQSMKIHH